jgi:hypothetical protein
MMRRRRSEDTSEAAFESHLSTVTKNGLGMLVLLAMTSTFSSSLTLGQPKFARNLGTPLIKLAPPDAKGAFFECRGGRAFPQDFDVVEPRYGEFVRAFRAKEDMNAFAEKFNNPPLTNNYYRFELLPRDADPDNPDDPAILCHPRKPSQGETLAEVQKPDSVFRKQLKGIDKKKDVVMLRVWPDSFLFFRDLRDWLQKEGYQVGWGPADKPISVNPHPGDGGRLPIG